MKGQTNTSVDMLGRWLVDADRYLTGRRYERRSVSFPVTLIVGSGEEALEHPAFILDLSERGARLKVNVPVPEGELVAIVPMGGARYAVLSHVIWEGISSDQTELGVEFLVPYSGGFGSPAKN